jgi:hypothetical protein
MIIQVDLDVAAAAAGRIIALFVLPMIPEILVFPQSKEHLQSATIMTGHYLCVGKWHRHVHIVDTETSQGNSTKATKT